MDQWATTYAPLTRGCIENFVWFSPLQEVRNGLLPGLLYSLIFKSTIMNNPAIDTWDLLEVYDFMYTD